MRTNIIDMILATEMTKHFEHLVKFVNVCNTRISFEDDLVEVSLRRKIKIINNNTEIKVLIINGQMIEFQSHANTLKINLMSNRPVAIQSYESIN